MAKQSQRTRAQQKRRRQAKREDKHLLDHNDLQQVVLWKDRVDDQIRKTLACLTWIEEDNLHSHEHALKSIEKYVENTTESIKQLDNLTKRQLFSCLIEIPVDNTDKSAMTWRNMIGMRDRLAHSFWQTDHRVLLRAVKNEFPKLGELFGQFLIVPVVSDNTFAFEIPTSEMVLPREIYQDGDPLSPGIAYTVAVYGRRHGWIVARMVKRAEPDVVQFIDEHGIGINSDKRGKTKFIWRK